MQTLVLKAESLPSPKRNNNNNNNKQASPKKDTKSQTTDRVTEGQEKEKENEKSVSTGSAGSVGYTGGVNVKASPPRMKKRSPIKAKLDSSSPTKGVGRSSHNSHNSNNKTMGKGADTVGSTNADSCGSIGEQAPDLDLDLDLAYSLDSAVSALKELQIDDWDTYFQTNIDSDKWQDKVTCLETISQKLSKLSTTDATICERLSGPLVAYLSFKSNNFKASNMNLVKALINTTTTCAVSAKAGPKAGPPAGAGFDKRAASRLIKSLGDKIGDKKLRDVAEGLLNALTEILGPSFVLSKMKGVADASKAVLFHQNYLEWVKSVVYVNMNMQIGAMLYV